MAVVAALDRLGRGPRGAIWPANVLVVENDLRELVLDDPGHDFAPETRARQHVVLVDGGEPLVPAHRDLASNPRN